VLSRPGPRPIEVCQRHPKKFEGLDAFTLHSKHWLCASHHWSTSDQRGIAEIGVDMAQVPSAAQPGQLSWAVPGQPRVGRQAEPGRARSGSAVPDSATTKTERTCGAKRLREPGRRIELLSPDYKAGALPLSYPGGCRSRP
jgi:hypothetical protein